MDLKPSLNFSQLLTIIIALGGVISVWVNTEIKLAKIEATIVLMQSSIEINYQSNKERYNIGFQENREDHLRLFGNIQEVQNSIKELSVQIAKRK